MSEDWTQRIGEQLARIRADGRWRAPRNFDARGPEGTLGRGDGEPPSPVVSFASNDYLGLSGPPGGRRGRPRGHRPVGHRVRRLAPRHRIAPGARGARAGTRGVEGHGGRGLLPDRLRRQPRRPQRPRSPGHPDPLRRAEPRIASSTAAGWPGPTSPSTATPTRRTWMRCWPRRTGRPWSSPTPSSRWTATSRRWPSWPRPVVATAHCSSSTRPTPSSALTPVPMSPTASRSSASGRCRRRSALSAVSPRARARWPTCSSIRPGPTSSRPPARRPMPLPASPPSTCSLAGGRGARRPTGRPRPAGGSRPPGPDRPGRARS